MTAFLALALAMSPLQAGQGTAPVPTRPSLPFESGDVRVINRGDAAGEADCSVAATSDAFRTYGDATCRRLIRPWPGPAIAAPVRESTMVISVATDVATVMPERRGRGTVAVDQEAEVSIAANGSVSQCRPLRESGVVSERAHICGGLMREGPGLFVPAQDQGERRARVRIIYFRWPDAPTGN